MAKKAIVLYGQSETGKTTTLKLVIDKITPLSTIIDRKRFKYDEWVVARYHNKTIAIVTSGDSKNDIEWYIKDINNNCGVDIDVYILACRSKGQSIDYIKRFFSYVLWERRWDISESNTASVLIDDFQNEANGLQADTIIKTIDLI